MKIWKSVMLLMLVFFAGIAVGVVGTRAFVRQVVQTAIVHPEKTQLMVEYNLSYRLHLDPDQQTKVHAILADARRQLAELRRQFQPQANSVLRGADQKISAVLTPEQEARYERIKDKAWPALQRLHNQNQPANSNTLNSN